MTRPMPGGPAPRASHQHMQAVQRLYREELPRVRTAAAAWRNGLAGLLAGLLGFSLIRGPSDVGKLSTPWAVLVGVLLLLSLVAGAYAAMRLIRAAHGLPQVVERKSVRSRLAAEHDEAIDSERALSTGIKAGFACAALLVTAVAMTWYSPEKNEPSLRVVESGETVCGSVVRVSEGLLTLETADGERVVDLRLATGVTPVESCRPS